MCRVGFGLRASGLNKHGRRDTSPAVFFCIDYHSVSMNPERPMSPRDLVKSWVDAFNNADPDALASFYATDAVNHQVAEEPVRGKDAIRTMFANGFASATMVCIVENIFEDGDWAILEWKDPLGLRGCGFFHVIDGKIAFQRGYWDKLSFLRQQGLPLPTE
jgi:limonene-1,2-epoxide hydrolase